MSSVPAGPSRRLRRSAPGLSVAERSEEQAFDRRALACQLARAAIGPQDPLLGIEQYDDRVDHVGRLLPFRPRRLDAAQQSSTLGDVAIEAENGPSAFVLDGAGTDAQQHLAAV